MARFLIYTAPARGHLYPIMPTVLELRRRGHDLHIRTLASEAPALESLGLAATPISSAIEDLPLEDWQHGTFAEAIGSIFGTFARRAPLEIDDLRAAIAEVNPEALLIDVTTPGAAAVAEASGLPWARWMPYLQHASPDPSAPPQVSFPPFSMAPPGLEVINQARAMVGLGSLTHADDLWRAPLNLYLTAPPFETPGLSYPPSFRLIGPGVWEPPAPAPSWLDDLPEPLVLVTTSSELQRDNALVDAAAAALPRDGLSVVISTAAHAPSDFTTTSGVRLARWLPHLAVMGRAACVICHGGMGVTQKALASGVPVCVVPFGRDQFGVAQQVTAAGAGTAVMPDRLTPSALLSAVREAMTMRAGAAAVAEGFRETGGAEYAADEVEAILQAAVLA